MKYIILILLAALAIPFAARSQAVILKTDTVSISCSSTDTFLMPVRVLNFTGVGSFQFTLSWNSAQLDYAYVTPGANNPFYIGGAAAGFDTTTFINSGKLTFTWTKVGGATFPDSTPVFYVAYRRVGGPFSLVEFVNIPVGIEVTDKNGDELPNQIMSGGVLPIDTVSPTITCPLNLTVQSSGPAVVNGINPTTLSDNCPLLPGSVGWSSAGATTAGFPTDPDASGASFNFGLSTVTYLITDVGGNTAACSFSIMVEPSNTSDTLTLMAGNGNASCGQSFAVPITALNFDSLGSLQFSIGWDTSLLKFNSISLAGSTLSLDSNNFGFIQTANGFVSFSWTSPTPLVGTTIPNGSLLFSVFLSPLTANSGMTQIQFGDFPTFREAYTSAVNPPEEVSVFYIPGQINITDNVPPTLGCPANIGVQTQPGELTFDVTTAAPNPAPTDNCSGAVALSYTQTGATTGTGTGNANGTYEAGSTTVTYTATDASGNTSTCSFLVFVDAGTPVLLTLDSVETDCAGTIQQNIAVNLTVENFKDLIGLQFSVQWDNTVLGLDTITNIFPGLGLTSNSAAFIYTDTASGIFRFLGGTTGTWPNIPDGNTFFTLNFIVKNPGALSPIEFLGPFDAVNTLFQSVLVNTLNGGFKSTVDTTAPEFVFCPSDALIMPTSGCNATVNFQAIVKDDCSGVQSLVSNQSDNIYEPGSTDVIFTATDSVGNTSECIFQVLVEASNNLQFDTCPPQLVIGYAPVGGGCDAAVFWQVPQITNVCDFGAVQIQTSHEPGDTFTVNVPVEVTIVAVDTITGNFANCTFTVVVLDTIAPTILCPKDTMIVPNGTNCSAILDLTPTVADNCDQMVDINSTIDLPQDTFPTGETTVTMIASDDTGNFSSCQFTVTVLDNEAPFFNCPMDITAETGVDSCSKVIFWTTPQAFDNCDTTVLAPTANIPSGSSFPVGMTIVAYFASDASGNQATCSFTITVTDTQSPTVTCPTDILLNLPITQCDTAVTWAPVTAADNCTVDSLTTDITSGSIFPAGTTTVTYTAKDKSGNVGTCSFTVTAKDGVRPQFNNCPNDITVNTTNPCDTVLNWTPPTATDNCTPPQSLIFNSSKAPTDSLPVGAKTEITITVVDASGNLDTCVFNIQINSTLVRGLAGIPTVDTLMGCEAIATWQPPVANNAFCISPQITSDYAPGDTFQLGTTVVTYTATDDKGITYTATFSVTVVETVLPVFTVCPAQPMVVNTAGQIVSNPDNFLLGIDPAANCSGAALTFASPAATDNCGVVVVEQTDGTLSGQVFQPGSSVLTFKATDESGNSTTCSVSITVEGLPAPTITIEKPIGCPGESVEIMTINIPGATYLWKKEPSTVLTDTDNVIEVTETGTYSVQISVGTCQTQPVSTSYTVAQKPDAVDDFTLTIDPGATDTFDVFLNDSILSLSDIKLSFSPLTNLDTLPGSLGKFMYTAGQVGGKASFLYTICSKSCPNLCDMATVTITVRETDCTFVPNIITPNNDSENDFLVIPCLDNSTLFGRNSIVIYNQWGDKVFEASPYKNDWGGTLNNEAGKNLPDGTYFYIFRPGPNEAVLKGFVEIFK